MLQDIILQYVEGCAPEEAEAEIYLQAENGAMAKMPVRFRKRARTSPMEGTG